MQGSQAERTAWSIADAGYKLATQLSLYLIDCVRSAISQVDSVVESVFGAHTCETVNKSSKSMIAI